mmetsp:Transcript_28050/g.47601  ORF Transcript_28050/g.47601 Transcript_28050/m.47601 type:complete len:204 (-) Transcript_28050:9-620(-)
MGLQPVARGDLVAVGVQSRQTATATTRARWDEEQRGGDTNATNGQTSGTQQDIVHQHTLLHVGRAAVLTGSHPTLGVQANGDNTGVLETWLDHVAWDKARVEEGVGALLLVGTSGQTGLGALGNRHNAHWPGGGHGGSGEGSVDVHVAVNAGDHQSNKTSTGQTENSGADSSDPLQCGILDVDRLISHQQTGRHFDRKKIDTF